MESRNILYLIGLILTFLPAFSYTYLSRSGFGEQPLLPQALSIVVFCVGLAMILFAERGWKK
ncbi:MAG: hypothetical protein WHS82_08105 [Candidatus Methanosuratincola sp.]|uniref:Uncharacterized protein n=1 Tax=Methanosuratincola subterraneus TaxID=2593994 RepID=A0A3S3S0N6_METS7|nr:MAG: hypothetical protein Metus_0638 [Candidatus Methanosuratincola subterraneus]